MKQAAKREEADLNVLTWNMRSAMSVVNRHALQLVLHEHKPTVVVLTETWAHKALKAGPDYSVYQSPLAAKQGVAVLVQAGVHS